MPLRSAQAVSVERDLSIADALEEYLYEPIEFDVDGSGFSQKILIMTSLNLLMKMNLI